MAEGEVFSKERLIRVALILFVSVSLPFFIDKLIEANRRPYQDSDPWYRALWNRDFWYRVVLRSGPNRDLSSKRVTIIMIKRGQEPQLALGENRCTHRVFMAHLLKKLKTTKAKVIVVDKFYSEPGPGDACPDSTQTLKSEVWDASEYAHLVFARNGYNLDRVYGFCLEPLDIGPDEIVLADQIDWPKFGRPDHVHEGVANFHLDNRWRMPLGWPAWSSCSGAKLKKASDRPPVQLTLAARAVLANDPNTLTDLHLDELKDRVAQPYVELLPAHAFQVLSAMEVLCESDTAWKDAAPQHTLDRIARCAQVRASPSLSDKIREYVVVGEYYPPDTWHTVGWVPGAFIHANYMEALLAGKYLRPVGKGTQFALNLFWLLAIQGIFLAFDRKPEFALLVSFSLSLLLGIVFFVFSVQNFGFLIDIVPPSLFSMIINYAILKLQPLKEA